MCFGIIKMSFEFILLQQKVFLDMNTSFSYFWSFVNSSLGLQKHSFIENLMLNIVYLFLHVYLESMLQCCFKKEKNKTKELTTYYTY